MSLSAKSTGYIRATPLRGGRSITGACTLLEVGGARILLDCGSETLSHIADIQKLSKDLVAAGGVDAVILAHGDLEHVGLLPFLLGKHGMQNIPVICTLPVGKFAKLNLYESLLSRKMEADPALVHYDFDDIDMSLNHIINVKYNQSINIPDTRGLYNSDDGNKRQIVAVVGIPSGRTLGGTIWRITCGPAEVLYVMDVNLKKDIVVDAINLEQLPINPTLLITEARCASQIVTSTTAAAMQLQQQQASSSSMGGAGSRRNKKDKDETTYFLNMIMETLRNNGNVLIPIRTSGRLLEVLQILSKHWAENKLGLYHLILLSHMGHNLLEYTKCFLEWMSDSLVRDFYNGKRNPFELTNIKVITGATSIKSIEKRYNGPKVILASDTSLNCGYSKEVLLRWGGDPRTKVIYFDRLDQESLSAQLLKLSHHPPIITSISKPVRVPLSGQELADFQMEQEKKRKLQEEENQRKKRQLELANFQVGQLGDLEEDESDMNMLLESTSASSSSSSAAKNTSSDSFRDIITKRLKTSAIAKYLNSNFKMFEHREIHYQLDEYGVNNDDLQFKDIQAMDNRRILRDRVQARNVAINEASRGTASVTGQPGKGSKQLDNVTALSTITAAGEQQQSEALPFKFVSQTEMVQFTCEFKEFNLSGRIDLKSMRVILKKVMPTRLMVIGSHDKDCDQVVQYAQSIGIESYAPKNRKSVTLNVYTDRYKIVIPRALLPTNIQVVKPVASSSLTIAGSEEDKTGNGACTVCVLKGDIAIIDSSYQQIQDGSRYVRFLGNTAETKEQQQQQPAEKMDIGDETDLEDEESTTLVDNSIGLVSKGEVTLNTIKQAVEANGVKTEFKLGGTGAVLVCAEQVIIKFENGQFAIEGPPVAAFFEARKAIYQQFAFI